MSHQPHPRSSSTLSSPGPSTSMANRSPSVLLSPSEWGEQQDSLLRGAHGSGSSQRYWDALKEPLLRTPTNRSRLGADMREREGEDYVVEETPQQQLDTPTNRRRANLLELEPPSSPSLSRSRSRPSHAGAFSSETASPFLSSSRPRRPIDSLFSFPTSSIPAPGNETELTIPSSILHPQSKEGERKRDKKPREPSSSLSPVPETQAMDVDSPSPSDEEDGGRKAANGYLEEEDEDEESQLPGISQLMETALKRSKGKERMAQEEEQEDEEEDELRLIPPMPTGKEKGQGGGLERSGRGGTEEDEDEELPSISQAGNYPITISKSKSTAEAHLIQPQQLESSSESPESSPLSSPEPDPSRPQQRQTQPAPAPSAPIIVNGRALRKRTATQLQPYSTEYAAYSRTLKKNDWQDAVVGRKFDKRREEELVGELLERGDEGRYEGGRVGVGGKEKGDRGEKRKLDEVEEEEEDGEDEDDLFDHRLETHYPAPPAPARSPRPQQPEPMDLDLASPSVLPSMPETTATVRRKPKRRLEVEADGVGERREREKRQKRDEREDSVASIHTDEEEVKERKKRKKKEREREIALSRREHGSRRTGADVTSRKEGDGSRSKDTAQSPRSRSTREKGDSHSTTGRRKGKADGPSRANRGELLVSRKKKTSVGKSRATTDAHPNRWRPNEDLDLEMLSDPTAVPSSEGGSEGEEEEDETEEQTLIPEANLELSKKQRRALRKVFPAVYNKKAEMDLVVMREEMAMGKLREDDYGLRGSGDEDERYGTVKVRKGKKTMPDDGLDDFYTDGSGSQEEEESEQEDIVGQWEIGFAPRRGENVDSLDRALMQKNHGSKKASKGKERARDPQRNPHSAVLASKKHDHRRQPPARRPRQPLDQTALFRKPIRRLKLFGSDDEMNQSSFPSAKKVEDLRLTEYASFSVDYGIRPIEADRVLDSNGLVARGHLDFLCEPEVGVMVMDVEWEREVPSWLDEETQDSRGDTTSSLEGLLPWVCDQVYDRIQVQLSDSQDFNVSLDPVELVECLNKLIASKLSADEQDSVLVNTQFNLLFKRLEGNLGEEPGFAKSILALVWFRFQLAHRMFTRHLGEPGGYDEVRALFRLLVRTLLEFGLHESSNAIEEWMTREQEEEFSVDIWVAVVALALEGDRKLEDGHDYPVNSSDLLFTIQNTMRKQLREEEKLNSLLEIERTFFASMFVSRLSQFNQHGIAMERAQLSSRWSIFQPVMDVLFANTNETVDISLSNSELTARDRYGATILKRCLLFTDRWYWSMADQEKILEPLLSIFKPRKLQNLRFEKKIQFPMFLQAAIQKQKVAIPAHDDKDSTFHAWLKIFLHTLWLEDHSQRSESDMKRIKRLIHRLVPVTFDGSTCSRSFTQASDYSSLINHYSIIIVGALVAPNYLPDRLNQARSLFKFAELNDDARHFWVRLTVLLTMISWREGLDLKPSLDMFHGPLALLRSEYARLDRGRTTKKSTDGQHLETTELDRIPKRMKDTTALVRLFLRAICFLRWVQKPRVEFPQMCLLSEEWTKKLLDSSLGLNPGAGREVVGLISFVLDCRDHALASSSPAFFINEESQHEYGFSNISDNSQLLDILEKQGETAREVGLLDEQLAVYLNDSIIPSLKECITRFYNAEAPCPVLEDEAEGAQPYPTILTSCWVRCLTIAIEHGKQAWSSLLRYESSMWYRIKDRIGRLQTAVLFFTEALEYDNSQYKKLEVEFITVWIQAAGSPVITGQSELTRKLLTLHPASKLFAGHPLDDAALQSQEPFEDKVSDLLDYVIEACGRMLNEQPGFEQTRAGVFPKSTIKRWLNVMFGAMRDHIQL
ncbi:hypothetical protein BT69DRAFT_1302893 [Atractiella rhizophila]|nr:hypothetical protein BT69DRAFT_1302893 [Atractiella rhizophila]